MKTGKMLAGGVIAASVLLAGCHKAEQAKPNAVNAAAESSNRADSNANDEMMDEDGSQAVANAE